MSSIREDIKQLKCGQRELRRLGLLVGAVFAVLGIFFWLRGKSHAPYFLVPGALLLLFGAVLPGVLKPVYIVWMSLAIVLGFVVSNVLLTVFFFVVITPVGLLARLAGKDFLRLKLHRSATSYWMRRESKLKTKASYERQF